MEEFLAALFGGIGCVIFVGFGVLVFGFIVVMVLSAEGPNTTEAELTERRRGMEETKRARTPSPEAVTELWLELKGAFPYLETPTVTGTTVEELTDGMAAVIHNRPHYGEVLGMPSINAPALSERERVRHLYIVGKSGSGKSTFLEHLIRGDIDAGRGLAVMGPEGDLFRQRLLPLIPEERSSDVIYFAPGDSDNTLALNPLAIESGTDRSLAAEELATILGRVFGDEGVGRMQVVLSNALGALIGREGATLWDVRRLLTDDAFRYEVAQSADAYIRDFWLTTYPDFPKGAALPILHRLDRFLRPAQLECLLYPQSSFSLRKAIASGKIVFVDLFGLSETNRIVIGQVLLSMFQLELMRREVGGAATAPFFLYCDEFQSFAGTAEQTWRELLSRGRKYGVGLTLAHQYPAQLPQGVRQEIFGNVGSMVSFKLGARDAKVLRSELLVPSEKGLTPIPATDLLERNVGEAVMRLAGGHAVVVKTPPPVAIPSPRRANKIVFSSRALYGAWGKPERFEGEAIPDEPESFFE